jgi:hypothetical protein
MIASAEKCPTCRSSIVRLVGLLRGATPVYAEVCMECATVVRSGRLQQTALSRSRRPRPWETRTDSRGWGPGSPW